MGHVSREVRHLCLCLFHMAQLKQVPFFSPFLWPHASFVAPFKIEIKKNQSCMTTYNRIFYSLKVNHLLTENVCAFILGLGSDVNPTCNLFFYEHIKVLWKPMPNTCSLQRASGQTVHSHWDLLTYRPPWRRSRQSRWDPSSVLFTFEASIVFF